MSAVHQPHPTHRSARRYSAVLGIAAALAMAPIAVACGSSEEPAESSTSSTPATTSATPSQSVTPTPAPSGTPAPGAPGAGGEGGSGGSGGILGGSDGSAGSSGQGGAEAPAPAPAPAEPAPAPGATTKPETPTNPPEAGSVAPKTEGPGSGSESDMGGIGGADREG